eukprot:gene19947-21900_t
MKVALQSQRKSEKGKEKKLRHKEEQRKIAEGKALLDAANNKKDPLDSLASVFRKYERNGLDISFSCKKSTTMTKDEKDVTMNLTKRNMQTLYEQSSWGWNDADKEEEMMDERAWYLLAKDQEDNVVAISHFRFDFDNDDEVLYCYEIQLEKRVRGKGLGKFMLQILELIGFRAKMKKVMVTVFKDNTDAVQFFNNLKFIVDETSPRYYDPMSPDYYDYEILSKSLMKKQT